MRRGGRAARRLPAVLAGLIAAACVHAPPATIAPPPSAPARDASWNWHAPLIVPFGTPLRALPVAVHEVLEFHAPGAEPEAAPECYALNDGAPRWLDHEPTLHLLCFRHDRLARVETSVLLPAEQAGELLEQACRHWSAPLETATTGAAGEDGARCAGGDAAAAFVARLSAAARGEQAVSVRLEAREDL